MSKKARNWLIGIVVAVVIVPTAGFSVWKYVDFDNVNVENHNQDEQP